MKFTPSYFYCHVNAVYNIPHVESSYNDSAYWGGIYIGIKENMNTSKFQITPNPFSSQTTLHSDKTFKDATLTVYNFFGQQVKRLKNISGQEIILHRDNLPSGLYFISVTQDNKLIATDKLIIE